MKKIVQRILILACISIAHTGFSQLLEQTFSSSTVVSDYVSATPSAGQWNAISTSGSGTVLSINTTGGNKLRFARSANAGAMSRTTDFAPVPSSMMMRFDLTVSGNAAAQTSAATFQIGSGFGTANSAEANASTHSRIGINWTATAGQFSIRNLSAGTNSAVYSGTQTVLWVINNSGTALTYKAPDGTFESVAIDAYDIWIGTTREINDGAATTPSQTLTDFKFAFSAGVGSIDLDNFLIDPIPAVPTVSAATSINANDFTANWSSVSGATGYRLDVSTASDFSSFVSGYNNLAVSGTSTLVSGLNASTPYFYRVRTERAFTVGTFTSNHSGTENPTTGSGGGPVASIAISGSSPAASSHNAGATNVVLGQFDLAVTLANATFNAFTVTTAGTYSAADLLNLKVRYSTDGMLDAGDAILSTKSTSLGTGTHVFPSFVSQLISSGSTGYVFVTADLATGATGGNNLNLAATAFSGFGFTSGTTTGSDPVSAGNIRTILSIPVLVTTPTISSVLANSAVLGGNATSTGGISITERGVYYSLTNGFADGAGTKVSSTGTFGTGSFTENISGLSGGTTYYFKSFATNSVGTVYSSQGSFSTPKPEPTNGAASFSCGTTTSATIPLTWTDASTGTIPDGYLIQWSSIGYGSISTPTDGTPVANGSNSQNVAQGIQTFTATGLSSGLTYYFTIVPYTNSGAAIDYNVSVIGQTSCATLTGPCLSEIFSSGATPAGWLNNGVSWTELAGTASFNAAVGDLTTVVLSNPALLTFDLARTSNPAGKTLWVKVSTTSQSSGFTTEATYDHSNTTANGTTACSVDLSAYTGFSAVYIRFEKSSATTSPWRLDNVVVTCGSSCSAPATTTSVTISSINSGGADVAWTGSAGDGSMVVIRRNADGNTLPASGTAYTANTSFTLAAQIDANNRVVFQGAGSSVSGITGLAPETQYRATTYNYNNTGNCYQLTSPASTTFYTLATEPAAHSAVFSATALAYNQISLAFSASGSNADGYLIFRRTGAAPTFLPSDANSYSVNSTYGDAILIGNVTSNATTSFSNTGLTASTDYYYILIPYNWDGTNPETYNYRTAVTVPLANATTPIQPSASSDILATSGYGTSDILYANYLNPLASSTGVSVGVMKFTIRDGGSGFSDTDVLNTVLDAITIQVNDASSIQSAALFGGVTQSSRLAYGVVSGNDLIFSSLSSVGSDVTALDGFGKDLTLRITFKTPVTDNFQLVYTITSANTAAAGASASSLFGAFANQVSNVAGTVNQIEVVADRLSFTTQPGNGSVNQALTGFTVSAVDGNAQLDQDAGNPFTLTTSSGSNYSSGSPYSLVNGAKTISDVVYSAAKTSETLTAINTGASLANSNVAVSGTFNIVDFGAVNGAFLSSVFGGSYTAAGTWCRCNNVAGCTGQVPGAGGWGALGANGTPGTSQIAYIQGTVILGNGSTSINDLHILSGGSFSVSGTGTFTINNYLKVYTNGDLYTGKNFVVASGKPFIAEDGADIVLDFQFASLASSIWKGVENFAPNSNLIVYDWDPNVPLASAADNTASTGPGGYQAFFGNVYIDFASSIAGTTPAPNWDGILGTGTYNLVHNNVEFVSARGNANFKLSQNTTSTVEIGGNLILSGGIGSSRAVLMATGSSTLNLTVKGNLVMDCAGDFSVAASNGAAGVITLTVKGNIDLSGSNSGATTNFSLNQNSYTTTLGFIKSKVNLEGNLTTGPNATLVNAGFLGDVQFNFTGTNTQLVDAGTTICPSPTSYKGIPFVINSGAKVQLANNNLVLNQNSSMTVLSGGSLDFNWKPDNTPLLVTQPASPSGVNTFSSAQGSTLYITSLQGLVKNTAIAGNVQLSVSNKDFNQTSTFWYTGKDDQVTGDGLTSGGTGKVVIVKLINNAKKLSVSNNVGISNGTLVDPVNGGRLEIQTGTVVGIQTADFTGSGRLVMTDGVYQLAETGMILPQLSGYATYSLTGGTIELNGNGSQILSGAPTSFYNLAVSAIGTKTVTSAIVVNNNVNISLGTLDLSTNGMTGNAGLTMTGGLLRIAKSSGTTFPEIEGISTPYNLTGGTVELYGTSSVGTSQLLRGTYGVSSQNVSYFNVELNANTANTTTANINAQASFAVKGTMNVNSPAVFQLDYDDIVSGTGTFNTISGSTLKYAEVNGITATACGAGGSCGQIRTANRNFSTGGIYGLTGNQLGMVSGNGLPSSIAGLMVERGGNYVSLSQNVTVTGNIVFSGTGMLTTGSNKIVMGSSSNITELELAHAVGQVETTRTLALTNHTFGGLGIEIDADGASPGSTVVTRYNGSDVPGMGFLAIKRWFRITPTVNSGLSATLKTSYFDDEINGLDESMFRQFKSDDFGTTWGVMAATPSAGTNSVTAVALDDFSDWTVAENVDPLPVSLLSFTGKAFPGKSILSWSTASETENSGYRILRSADGKSFHEIGFFTASGSSSSLKNYELTDNRFNQSYYYQLVQVDESGKEEVLRMIHLDCGCGNDLAIQVYPNPGAGKITLQPNHLLDVNEEFDIQLFGMDGRILLSESGTLMQVESALNDKVAILPGGVYSVKILNQRYQVVHRLRRF